MIDLALLSHRMLNTDGIWRGMFLFKDSESRVDASGVSAARTRFPRATDVYESLGTWDRCHYTTHSLPSSKDVYASHRTRLSHACTAVTKFKIPTLPCT